MKIDRIINRQNIYLLGLAMIATGLPFNKVVISLGQMIIAGIWLLDISVLHKFRDFFRNKTALIITSLFLLHVIGVIYSTDFAYAYKDLKLKFPILVITLVVSTSEPLDRKRFHALLLIFITAVVASTFACLYHYLNINFADIRNVSIFISHIRLSLLICLSIFILFYLIFRQKEFSKIIKILFLLIILWLITFLIILDSVTGLSILIIIGYIILLIRIFNVKNKFFKAGFAAILILLPVLLFFYINSIYKELNSAKPEKIGKLENITPHGNFYSHDTLSKETENGHRVWTYICEDELKPEWNKRSKIKYDSTDMKGQRLEYTLIRYLTSKGLRKDAGGVEKLTKDDIHAIENGIGRVNFNNEYSIHDRIYEILLEYNYYRLKVSPNGHSVMQRLEYWKASLGIIKEHLLIGVGTGDMNLAFAKQYDKMKSPLDKKWRLRSHNQYLSIAVGFGLIGLIWFLFILFYPLFKRQTRHDYYYLVFLAIILISMLTEDTLETQIGLTFFIFFNDLFLLGRKQTELSD